MSGIDNVKELCYFKVPDISNCTLEY